MILKDDAIFLSTRDRREITRQRVADLEHIEEPELSSVNPSFKILLCRLSYPSLSLSIPDMSCLAQTSIRWPSKEAVRLGYGRFHIPLKCYRLIGGAICLVALANCALPCTVNNVNALQ